MSYADNIKDICKARGITLSQLADQLGVKYQSLSKAINQDYPTLQTLERISIILDCDIADIVGGASASSFRCPHCGKRIDIMRGGL